MCAGTQRGRSTSALSRAVRAGWLKRLRPGVFVSVGDWDAARLSQRHRAFTAAVGKTSPSAVFCGHTALSLYGVPLLSWPREVHCRTRHRSRVGGRQNGAFAVRAKFPLKSARMSRPAAEKLVSSGELPLPQPP
ncbi:type IV toxin-antitoxin system AbiEi family antitoxin domain-containing protein [Nesterenkonia haasae]|uniref:type IV toxin-antitoxin system AbiEi family antitoxin domain-containing protein n=1 Tax=Nesterenkonia haasae TaxID=2587813 RepID=UPI0038B2E2E5